jgi:hypothetical protein
MCLKRAGMYCIAREATIDVFHISQRVEIYSFQQTTFHCHSAFTEVVQFRFLAILIQNKA